MVKSQTKKKKQNTALGTYIGSYWISSYSLANIAYMQGYFL